VLATRTWARNAEQILLSYEASAATAVKHDA
jgi:hypothetical protein